MLAKQRSLANPTETLGYAQYGSEFMRLRILHLRAITARNSKEVQKVPTRPAALQPQTGFTGREVGGCFCCEARPSEQENHRRSTLRR